MAEKIKYVSQTQGGYPCTEDGISNIETAEKIRNKDPKQVKKYLQGKVGNAFPKLEACALSMKHIFENYKVVDIDQLRLLEIFYYIYPLFDIDPYDLKGIWPGVQLYFCQTCKVEMVGVQGYGDYFET